MTNKLNLVSSAIIIAASFFATGCATICAPKNSSVVLFDSPKDLVVTENGNNVPIEQVLGDAKNHGMSGYAGSYTTYFYTSGIKLDRRHSHTLEFSSAGKKGTLELKPKVHGGYIFLDLFTFGPLGIAIDAATGKWKVLRRHNVDVTAVLNHQEMRSPRQLKKSLRRKLQ